MENEYIRISDSEYAIRSTETQSISDVISARDARLEQIVSLKETCERLQAEANALTAQIDQFNSLPITPM